MQHPSPAAGRGDPSAKTVFVMDHTQYFGISSECPIDLDFGKLRSNQLPLPTISKSLWTSAVESSVEYCRIVWDLFPTGKLVSASDRSLTAHITYVCATRSASSLATRMRISSTRGIPPTSPLRT